MMTPRHASIIHPLRSVFGWLPAAALLALVSGCGTGGGGGGTNPASSASSTLVSCLGPPPSPTLGRLAGLSGPMGIAVVSVCDKPRALVLEEAGEISLADLETGEVKLMVAGLSSPFAIVMEPDAGSTTALVTETNRLSRVDLKTGTIAAVALFANQPTGLAINPAQPDAVWVVENGTGDLSLIRRSDGATEQVVHPPGLARARGLAFEKPGVLLVAEGDTTSGGIIRVDLRASPPTFTTLAAGRPELKMPFGFDLGAGADFAYVTAQAADQLARLDGLASGAISVRTQINSLKGPTGIARLADGRLVIAQHATNDLLVLDPVCAPPPCQPPAAVVAGLGTPGDLVIEGPDTALVIERNDAADSGALSRVDTRTGRVTEIASALATPEALVLAGRTVYVAEAGLVPNTSNGQIRRIPLDTGAPTVLSTAALSTPSGMALADPSTLVISERIGSLVRVNLSDGKMTRLPLTSGTPAGMAVAQGADGNTHAYVTDAFSGTLLKVRDVATCNPCSSETIATNLQNPSGVAVESSGNSALVVTDTGKPWGGAVVRVFLQGTAIPAPSTIVEGLSHPQRIVIEPSGTTALVTDNNPDGITRVALPPP